MASEATFNTAATELDSMATRLRSGFEGLDGNWSNDVVSGGRLARTVQQTLDATHANTMTAITELGSLADECRRRAAVCAAHAEAMRVYHAVYGDYQDARAEWNRHGQTGEEPVPPARPPAPPAWVGETSSPGGYR